MRPFRVNLKSNSSPLPFYKSKFTQWNPNCSFDLNTFCRKYSHTQPLIETTMDTQQHNTQRRPNQTEILFLLLLPFFGVYWDNLRNCSAKLGQVLLDLYLCCVQNGRRCAFWASALENFCQQILLYLGRFSLEICIFAQFLSVFILSSTHFPILLLLKFFWS